MLFSRIRSLCSSLILVSVPLTSACGGGSDGTTGFDDASGGNTVGTTFTSSSSGETDSAGSESEGEGSGSGQSNTGSETSSDSTSDGTVSDTATSGESSETAESGSETGSTTDTSMSGTSGTDSSESSSASSTDGESESSSTTDGTTTSTTSSTSTTTDSSGETGIEPCQVETTEVTPIPPNIMLVLDKSGSMSNMDGYWDHDSDPMTPDITRWNTLHAVVDNLLTTWESDVKFGAKLFPKIDAPSSGGAACEVDSGVETECALDNRAAILASIPTLATTVYGGTPMETGLDLAFAYLETLPTTEPRAVLLVADGAVSCSEQIDDAVDLVTNAAANEIPTYVVGIDAEGTTVTQLNDLAIAGGKPDPNGPESYYQTQNQADLDEAMQSIINDTLSCVITIDPVPNFPDLLEVWINDMEVPMVADCNSENGWVWTQQYSEIELCGTACEDLRTYGTLESRYYCEPS